ncbi:MAG TPA: 50S ribosomal protein L4 [Acidobacteria bacterium]|nr:50S ribosomal protein L4 [Acidobacteriota bacterium]
MADVAVVNLKRESVGKVELPDAVFDYPWKRHLLYEAVHHYLACARRGTHKVKNRVEVSGGGKKPWRQKGTGRARVGSMRSPIWRGGGIVHGPQPRDYSYRFPRKARRRALASALSDKLRGEKLVLVESLEVATHKTKDLDRLVRKDLGLDGKTLLVFDGENEKIELASRNHTSIGAIRVMQLHAYHVLNFETVVITRVAAEQLGEVLAR